MCCGGLARPFAQPLLCGGVLYVAFFFFFLQDQSSRSCGHETQISSLSHFSTVILPITPPPFLPLTPDCNPTPFPIKACFPSALGFLDGEKERGSYYHGHCSCLCTVAVLSVCAQWDFRVVVCSYVCLLSSGWGGHLAIRRTRVYYY